MLQNYNYFLTLSETLNISRAAEQLYISHQCLSRYLKKLEDECGLTLFERKPALSLTYAGQVLLESFREIQRIEQNTGKALTELKAGDTGLVRLGITEGRLRIVLPELLKRFGEQFPNVTLKATAAPTKKMLAQLTENKLELVLGTTIETPYPSLNYSLVMEEELYLVVSDNLLRQYFPDSYPDCVQTFVKGADLALFQDMPFSAASKGYNSRSMIDEFLQKKNISLNIVYEANQPDLLHIMTAQDYAASFSLSMYLPNIQTMNRSLSKENRLHVFPIQGLEEKNPLFLVHQKGKYFPKYTKELIKLIREQCMAYLKAE